MKKIIISFFAFLLILIPLFSIDLPIANSAFANTYGQICFLHSSPSNSFYNPSFSKPLLETSVTQLFSLKDLAYYNLYYGKKIQNFMLTTGLSLLNNELYKEGEFIISLSKNYLNLNWGISQRTIFIKISEEKTKLTIAFDFGIHKRFKYYSLAFSWKNLTNSKLYDEKLPIIYLWETSINPIKNTILSIGLEKQAGYDFNPVLASAYHFTNYFSIFSGYRFNPQRLGIGFNILIKNINLAYSILTHPNLPLTQYITIGYAI